MPFRLAVFAAFALVLTWPLLSTAPSMNFFRDAQVLMPYEHTAARSVLDHLQLPFWDPYYCGGVYSLGTPQSRFVSPTFLLSLLFGTLRAESLTAFFMILAGLEGTWRYASARGASPIGALLAAPVFAASGVFANAAHLGWINFFGFELVPWVAFGVHRAARGSLPGAILGALALAWIVGFGGTYAAPMAALLCVFEVLEGIVHAIRRRSSVLQVVAMSALCAALAIGLAAVRLWPIAETLADAPRVIADAPGYSWSQVWVELMGKWESARGGGHWTPGYFLAGILAVPVAVIGLLRWRALSMLLLGGLTAWAATGYAEGWSPFVGLRRFPLFATLRYPERYLIFTALAFAVLAAWGLSAADAWARKRPVHLWALVLLSAFLLSNAALQVHNHYRWDNDRVLVAPPDEVQRPFAQARGNRWILGYYAPMSRGSLSCWDAYPIPQSTLLRSDLPAEEYLVEPSAGSVRRTLWSPHRIDLAADLQKPARVRINQNWHPGWRSSVGRVVNDDGLLALDLPSGSNDVRVRFLPRSGFGGAIGSVIAIGVAGWLVRRSRKHDAIVGRRAWLSHAGLVLAPLAALLLVRVAWSEPRFPPRLMTSPAGDPVLADDLPPGTTRLDVRYTPSVALVGSRVDKPVASAGSDVDFELIWSAGPGAPRTVGIFVHVEPPGGAAINRDHFLVSSAVELADAPAGKLLRDHVAIAVPPGAKRGTWTVWAGLWHARGDQALLPIQSPGSAEVVGGRVKAGTFEVR